MTRVSGIKEILVAWGSWLEGHKNQAGWGWEKRRTLGHIILSVVDGRSADVSIFQNLGGCLIQAFMFNRPLISVLHHFYKYVKGLERGVIVILPESILDELVASGPCSPTGGCSPR